MKNLLLFSAILITSASVFAQLTVKPTTGGSDSYVYVKDQILYVEDDINLTPNPTASVEASIYLRENGQLIQGGTTSNNTGTGFLSVQQNTNPTNAYAYYYWASPVGNPTITPTAPATGNNTNFGVGSLYDPVGSSLTNANVVNTLAGYNGTIGDPITVSTRWLYTHETPGTEAEGNYHRMYGDNNAPPGFGFTMKGVGENNPGHDQIYEFRGRPNSGDFAIPVKGPVGIHPNVTANMTLSGNPYPSALDLNKLYHDPSNSALGTFYYYDEDRTAMTHYYSEKPFGYGVWVPGGPDTTPNDSTDFLGAYTAAPFYIWNSGGGSSNPGGSGGNDQNKRYAPIGQGFMLVGKNNGPAVDIFIRNEHRVFIKEGAPGSVFQRPPSGNEANEGNATSDTNPHEIITYTPPVDMRMPQLRLYTIFDNALTRDMLLILSDETTDGYDRGYDGLSPAGLNSDVFFPITGTNGEELPYVIQGTNYDVDKQIPITLKLDKTSLVEVRAVAEINVPYERAYLFDNQENTYTRLSRGSMSTGFTLPAGVYEDRFYIVFRNPNLRSDIPDTELLAKEAVQKNVNFFQNNPAHQLEVRNPQSYVIKSAEIYDMAGKLVITDKNLGNDTKYTFYTGNLSDGMYLVKLITSEDITIDYKAIVHNK